MAKQLPVITPEDLDSFTLTRTSSGFALKAFHVPWNIPISVKLLSSQNAAERKWKLLLQDVEALQHYQSDHLLPPLGIYQHCGLVGTVTEWMNNGSLHSLIHEHQLYPELPLPLLLRILWDVAEGLCCLHSLEPALCHGSLKPSNVLLDAQYRAKISDYGLTSWRKEQQRSDLQKCNYRNCQDFVYLSPETLEGGFPSQEGDIYSFGILCWESISREKPFEGNRLMVSSLPDEQNCVFLPFSKAAPNFKKWWFVQHAPQKALKLAFFILVDESQKTLLEILTKICSGLRPGTSAKFIPSNLPQKNRLLQLIALCWHQEPDYRPHITECTDVLKGILANINKEAISTAVYILMDAKETALNACKGSETYTLQAGICNSETICPQENHQVINKKIPLLVPNLSAILLDSSASNSGKENTLEMALANTIPPKTTTQQDHPGSDGRKSNLGPSFPALPLSGATMGRESSLCHKSPREPLQHRPQTMNPEQALTGPCCKRNCCQILTCHREAILSCMTEGRLNRILDVLRSQQTMSRVDYEAITSYPTVTARARALLDTCLCLGERAAQVVVTAVNKCSPLAQRNHCTDCLSRQINKLLQ